MRGPLLGVMPHARFSPFETAIAPGEMLVLVTDGVTEARSPEADPNGTKPFFGSDRLLEVIERHSTSSASEVARSISDSVVDFGGGRLADDLAILVVRATA